MIEKIASQNLEVNKFEININKARELGPCVCRFSGKFISPLLKNFADSAIYEDNNKNSPMDQYFIELKKVLNGRLIGLFCLSEFLDLNQTKLFMENIQPLLAERACVLIDNADFTSIYDGLKSTVKNFSSFRFHEIHIDFAPGTRAGQGIAFLSHESSRTEFQKISDIPESKNKDIAEKFFACEALLSKQTADNIVNQALERWVPDTNIKSEQISSALESEFPDGASPKTYWHEAYQRGFTEFFAWGHDQDFGFGRKRQGTMSTRHMEIVSESIQYGYLPVNLNGLEVLDVGCWTGGDVLALAGMGARVTALEEHPISAAAASRMCSLLGVPAEIHSRSLFTESTEWTGTFDVVYISGVIYHVTDPVLALRICFAYLKPGGRIVVETKASRLDGALCEYGGTHEKGWNWYSPTLETLGRWLVDAGFPREQVRLHMRPVGRLLAGATKSNVGKLPERAGFSRPNSWLESSV